MLGIACSLAAGSFESCGSLDKLPDCRAASADCLPVVTTHLPEDGTAVATQALLQLSAGDAAHKP